MGKNLPPFSKALILFVYFSTIFMMAVLSGGSDTDINLSNPEAITTFKLLQAFSGLVVFILPAIFFVLFTSEKKLAYFKLKNLNPQHAFIVLLLVLTAMPLINWLGEINSRMALPAFLADVEHWMKLSEEKAKVLTKAFLIMESPLDLFINIIVIALLAAVGEELLFRGALQNVLVEWSGKIHLSVWVSAIIFSALHAQFYGFLPRMMLGVVLGYLYVWSGSLWLPMLFHFLNNAMAVLVAYLIGKGIVPDEAETVGAEGTPFYYVAMSLVVSGGILYFIYKNQAPSNSPQGGES